MIIDKTVIHSPLLSNNKTSFYNYAVKLLLKDTKGKIKDAVIKIDGQGERTYKQAMSTYLRRELNTPKSRIISKLKIVDSRKDILIQLADMASGAIYQSCYKEKKDSQAYIKILKPRIENIWIFR